MAKDVDDVDAWDHQPYKKGNGNKYMIKKLVSEFYNPMQDSD